MLWIKGQMCTAMCVPVGEVGGVDGQESQSLAAQPLSFFPVGDIRQDCDILPLSIRAGQTLSLRSVNSMAKFSIGVI